MAKPEASFAIKATDETKKAFASVQSSLTSTTAKVTALVGAGGFGALVVISGKATVETYNYAKALGDSTQKLTAFGYAANTVNIGQEKLNDILKDVSEKIGDAYANNAGEAVDALNRLNLSAETLAHMRPSDQLLAIAEQLGNVGTQAEKVQILEGLGSDASLLLPLLENNASKLRELSDEAITLGVAVSDIDAAMLKAANDEFNRAQGSIKGVGSTIAVALAPYVAEVSKQLADAAKESGGFKDEILGAVKTGIVGVGYLGDGIRGLEVAFDVAKWAATGFSAGFYQTLDLLQDGIVGVINLIPGVAIEPSKVIDSSMREAVRIFNEARAEMDATAMKGLPSDAIEKYLNDLEIAATKRSEVMAGSNGAGPDPVVVQQGELTEEWIDEHNARIYEKQAEWEAKRAALIKSQRQAELNLTGDIFQNLSTLMGSENKKQFELGKKAAIAGALVKGYQAVVNSYEKGTEIGGPVVGAIFAGTAAIATKMQIDAIRRQQFNGGGGSTPNISGGGGNQANDPGSTPPINPLASSPNQGGQQVVVNVTVVGNAVGVDELDKVIADAVRRGIDNDSLLF